MSATMTSDSEPSIQGIDNPEEIPAFLLKERQKCTWHIMPELLKREIGSNVDFYKRCYSSVHMVEHLDIMTELEGHEGPVNALSFNPAGNLLASGSDDLHVRVWNWAKKKSEYFSSGHEKNVFQTKWLPFLDDVIATSDRAGEVRLLNLERRVSDLKAHHHSPTRKLATHPDTPDVIISVGEDARILSIDIREHQPKELCLVTDGMTKVRLYSIDSNPLRSYEFCVCGRSPTVRIYDYRYISKPVHKLCPKDLTETRNSITSAVYNYNGSEVLASHTHNSIYLFDAANPKQGEYLHRYSGHWNAATVKAVNFFGLKSEYVISGSDCSTIFIWEKDTEAVVQSMKGDSRGSVNVLEQHPHVPILATSGLDSEIKIWIPSRRQGTVIKNLARPVPMDSRIGAQGIPAYRVKDELHRFFFQIIFDSEDDSDSDFTDLFDYDSIEDDYDYNDFDDESVLDSDDDNDHDSEDDNDHDSEDDNDHDSDDEMNHVIDDENDLDSDDDDEDH